MEGVCTVGGELKDRRDAQATRKELATVISTLPTVLLCAVFRRTQLVVKSSARRGANVLKRRTKMASYLQNACNQKSVPEYCIRGSVMNRPAFQVASIIGVLMWQ